MIIKDIEFIPLMVPRKGVLKTSLGIKRAGDAVLVIVKTDSGLTGAGEVSSIWDTCSGGLLKGVGERLKEAVIGTDAFSVTRIHSLMNEAVKWNKNALCFKAGIEMAVYDLLGKTLGIPVYKLLGGKNRDRILVSRSVSMGTVENRIKEAGGYLDFGYKVLKFKIGENTGEDIETIKEFRKAYGYGPGIRIDANMSWKNQKDARDFIQRVCGYEIMSIEQPYEPGRIKWLCELRKWSPVSIMADESAWDENDALNLIINEGADIINTYVSEAGGLYNAMLIAGMCRISGTGFCIGSMPELGIGTAAAVHLGIAAPVIDHPCDVIGNHYFEEDIIKETLPFEDGYALSIESPGLGVSLDFKKIDRFRTDRRNTI